MNKGQLIQDIYEILEDYRHDDFLSEKERLTTNRIEKWINQFKENDRLFLLKELKQVFSKMFFSKERVKNFLRYVLEESRKQFGYRDITSFLENTCFLDLQEEGKSQKEFLKLLKEIVEIEHKYLFSDIGKTSKKHYLYIDDILCTGNTFYRNLKDWLMTNGKEPIKLLQTKEINLNVWYICRTKRYYDKKIRQLNNCFTLRFQNFHKSKCPCRVDESLLKPLISNETDSIKKYKEKVIQKADDYAHTRGYSSYKDNFFREDNYPKSFFSSKESRNRLECIFLEKGIEILNTSNIIKDNIRPLGYSLPSYKDFGLGVLFFTWRNIPNNTPLVFWYVSPAFMPLFVNKR